MGHFVQNSNSTITHFLQKSLQDRLHSDASEHLRQVEQNLAAEPETYLSLVREKHHIPQSVPNADIVLYLGAEAAYLPAGNPTEIAKLVKGLKSAGVEAPVPGRTGILDVDQSLPRSAVKERQRSPMEREIEIATVRLRKSVSETMGRAAAGTARTGMATHRH